MVRREQGRDYRALALLVAISAHADPLGSKMTPAGLVPGVAQLNGGSASGGHPMPGERGTVGQPVPLHPAQPEGRGRSNWAPNHANARGVPIRHGEGEAPTCPMYGVSPLFPTATMVTGARCGIPTQYGEVRMGAGVIPSRPVRLQSSL